MKYCIYVLTNNTIIKSKKRKNCITTGRACATIGVTKVGNHVQLDIASVYVLQEVEEAGNKPVLLRYV